MNASDFSRSPPHLKYLAQDANRCRNSPHEPRKHKSSGACSSAKFSRASCFIASTSMPRRDVWSARWRSGVGSHAVSLNEARARAARRAPSSGPRRRASAPAREREQPFPLPSRPLCGPRSLPHSISRPLPLPTKKKFTPTTRAAASPRPATRPRTPVWWQRRARQKQTRRSTARRPI